MDKFKKIKRRDIIKKMSVADAVHKVAADYPDVVFYIGSKSGFFFIGTAEEFDNYGIDENIGKKYYDIFVRSKYRTTLEYMDTLGGIPSKKDVKSLDAKLDVWDKRKYAIERAWNKMMYYDAAVRYWKPITERIVKDIYIKDERAEFDIPAGLVISIDGCEDGQYWFYHEFKTGKIQRDCGCSWFDGDAERGE